MNRKMGDADSDRLVEENRCWACTVSNAAVATLIAGVPLLAGVMRGDPAVLAATAVWALAVFGYTLYRLLARGYLPGADAIAKRTGLHDRLGPGGPNGRTGGDTRCDQERPDPNQRE